MAAWFDSVTWLVELRMDLLGGAVAWYDAGLASTPTTTTATWIDVSDKVIGMTLNRGRNDELDQYTAGTASIRLDNRDRIFDPNHTTGPYYGQLVPRMRVRVRATYAGVIYGVWSGVVDDWPQTWQKPSNAWVDLPCTDLTYLLSVADVPSWWKAYVESLAPWAWYRLGTDAGLDYSGNARHGTVDTSSTVPTVVVEGLVENASTGASRNVNLTTTASTTTATATTIVATVAVAPWPADTLRSLTLSSNTVNNDLRARVPSGRGGIFFFVNGNRRSAFLFGPPTAGGVNCENPFGLNGLLPDDQPVGFRINVAVVRDGTTAQLYVDGVLVDSDTVSTSSVTMQPTISGDGFDIDEFLVFDRALTAAEIASLAAEADIRLVMRTDEWADAVLDAIGWPAGDRQVGSLPFADATFAIAAGRDTPYDGSPATNPGTGSVLAILRQLERTEQGRCFISKDGNVVFRTRTWSLSNSRTTTSQTTFGDTTGELGYSDVGTNESGERLRNVWIVGDVTATDPTSITRYGRSTGQVDGLWSLPTEEDSLARWLVSRYKDPSTRVVNLDVEVRADTATIAPAVLGLELGDLVTVRRRPQGIGSTLEVIATVESITHNVTAQGRWTVSIQTGKRMAPAGTTYAVVGTATVGGSAAIAP